MVVYISYSHAFAVVEVKEPHTDRIIHSIREVVSGFGQDEWKTQQICYGFQSYKRACQVAEDLDRKAFDEEIPSREGP